MRILLDQNMPRQLVEMLPDHDVVRAFQMGWSEIENGALLAAAEHAGFDLLVTADQGIRYQQNLAGRRIGLVVLSSNSWRHIREYQPAVIAAIEAARQGGYQELELPRPSLRHRPPPDRTR